jgi:chlorobactene glucosyltransferase
MIAVVGLLLIIVGGASSIIMLLFLPLTLLCLLVVAFYVQDVARELVAPRLGPRGAPPLDGPLVSVLIPARDEAGRIRPCLDGLARQTYRRFEVIVVDDRSSDSTAEVVRSCAERLEALEIVSGAPLPAGWAGKCWACWQAVSQAHGGWLLFLDADVVPHPGLLAALIARAEGRQLDLLTAMPLLRLGSLAELAILPAFMSLLYGLYPLDRVSDPRDPIAFANGQCLLVRRQVYEAIGGHQAVRASILEDTDLGQRIKAAGYRVEAVAAPDLIEVRMYTSWPSLAEGLGKNAVAGYRSGGARSALLGVRQALVAFLPWYLLVAGGLLAAARIYTPLGPALVLHGALLAIAALVSWGWIARRRYRIAATWGLLFALGMAIYFGLTARALLRLRLGHGVTWKGRRFG